MEPTYRSSRFIPKMQLLTPGGASSPHSPSSTPISERSNSTTGGLASPMSQQLVPQPPAQSDRIFPPRTSSNQFTLEDTFFPRLPRVTRRQPMDLLKLESANEISILHPTLDITDESGEYTQLLLNNWSLDTGQEAFASISLFCEMKMNEAKQMTSRLDNPNRFLTTVCCQLLEKYARHIESQNATSTGDTFLSKLHNELVQSIFAPSSSALNAVLSGTSAQSPAMPASTGGTLVTSWPVVNSSGMNQNLTLPYNQRVPFFVELKRLKQDTRLLLDNIKSREMTRRARRKLSSILDRILEKRTQETNSCLQRMIFKSWKQYVTSERQIRNLKCQAFRSTKKATLSTVFQAWRIEALRKAYQRESVDYQTMLSITAASLSRKDAIIAEAEQKMAAMNKMIESLTESNSNLLTKVEKLEYLSNGEAHGSPRRGAKGAGNGTDGVSGRQPVSGGGSSPTGSANDPFVMSRHRTSVESTFERIDTIASQNSEKLDRLNRMLLETLFGMARMVESCAIQMSKDVMDSLEFQLDGSILQRLAEMIHIENMERERSKKDSVVSADPFSTSIMASNNSPSSSNSSAGGAMAALANARMFSIRDVAQMPVDAMLLKWAKMNLQNAAAAEKPADRIIKNFTSDLCDGRKYSCLLNHLFPSWFDANMAHEIDTDERLKNIACFHSRIQPELPRVVTSDSIHAGCGTENATFIAMLFGASVGSIRRIDLEKQRAEFINIITSWKRVRSLMLEVKRMNENYDSLMVVHLLKEMRTCETLFKQLNSELSTIAIISNETSSAMSQIAFKILFLTWNCLTAQAKNQPVQLIDERSQERIKQFTQVDMTLIRDLLMSQIVDEGNHATVPEKEVHFITDAMREVLVLYAKDLHDIFRHYCASTGTGSIVGMSLAEYSKFIKDSLLIDNDLTVEAADALYIKTMTGGPAPTKQPAPQESEVREMLGPEFVEVLIRIATVKVAELPLHERVRVLLDTFILPNALRSQSEIFRAEVASSQVRAVYQKHKQSLQRIFRYYSSMNTLRERQSTLTLKEFTIFARDCKLVGTFVTDHTLKQILANIQHEEDDQVAPTAVHDPNNDLRVDFTEFQEAIAALTEHVICNPYVPLYKRIEQFINELILPRARQKKKQGAD